MRDAVRSLVAAAVPAAVVALLWARLEEPAGAGALLAVAALGIVPAVVQRLTWRLATAAATLVVGLSAVFTVSPLTALPWTSGTWLGAVLEDAEDGFRGFERVAVPFDTAEHPTMHALVLTAVLGFSLVVALAVAAARPLLAGAAAAVGGGWATASVIDGGHELALGGLLLAATLWPLLVLRVRSGREAVAAGVALLAVVAVAVGAAGAGAQPSAPYLEWRTWSLLGPERGRVGVSYVWDAQYDGITFPARRTTVLRIRADRSALYWRASTLDLFTADRWLENLYPVAISQPVGRLPADPLLPARASDADAWVKQEVEVVRLDDDRLIAAGQPMRVEGTAMSRVYVLSGGVMRAPGGIDAGDRYTIWGYAPRPLPRELLASRPRYPRAASRYLAFDRAVLPAFGLPGREVVVDDLFTDDRYLAVRSYRPLWEAARRVADGAGSPYEATLAVERWLRETGGFRYEERPPAGSRPPLVDFVTGHRSGYCQHFAGTMALMLRLLGVPARVAVGFTSGRWKDGVWDVADQDAHAWVEAWFRGYGWVTFDPTPGRGTLTAGYTFASDSADAIRALGRGALLDVVDFSGTTTASAPAAASAATEAPSSRRGVVLALALLALSIALGSVAGLKALRRWRRYAARDGRRLALAVRLELEDVLRDQRVAVRRGAGLDELREATERGLGVPSGALVEALGRARFGPPERAAQAAADARRELRRVLELMRDRIGPGRRVRGAVSLRSLLPRRAV